MAGLNRSQVAKSPGKMPYGNSPDMSSIPRIKIRVESLSDLVFGLALSIGSLELIARAPQNAFDLAVSVRLFAFSIFIVVSIWLGYARIIAIMPQETGRALALNILLLFLVVLEPYLFFVLQSTSLGSSFLDSASFEYAFDVGGMFLILGGMVRITLQERKKQPGNELHPILHRRLRLAAKFYTLIGALYLTSALPFFWVDSPIGFLRFAFWYSAFGFVFFGVINRRRERTGATVK